MRLSILICHLEGRATFKPLLETLKLQIENLSFKDSKGVEIIVETDNGEMTVGKKRNILLEKASGDYVCFVDDDDMVPDYFVAEILKAIVSRNWFIPEPAKFIPGSVGWSLWPHVIGLKGHYTVGDGKPQTFIHSIRYKEWKTVDGIHQRCPNHLNPVKRELALKAGFTEKDHGEDLDYSMALLPLLKTEVFVDRVMYYYRK